MCRLQLEKIEEKLDEILTLLKANIENHCTECNAVLEKDIVDGMCHDCYIKYCQDMGLPYTK